MPGRSMATSTLTKRVDSFAVPGGLRGQLAQLPLPEILQHLRTSRATGVLSLVSGGARKALYVKTDKRLDILEGERHAGLRALLEAPEGDIFPRSEAPEAGG